MWKKLLAALLGLSFGLVLALHCAPAAASILTSGAPNGTAGGNLCLDVRFDSLKAGTPVGGVGCNASPAEQVEWNGYTVFLIGGQRCLDVYHSENKVDAPIVSAVCNNSGAQQWYYMAGAVINQPTSLCLDSGGNGEQLFLNTCNGSSSQTWQIK